jgi:hypothetical protein
MRISIKASLSLLLASTLGSSVLAVFSLPATGKCVYPSDLDSRGRRCGGRASSVRPGGENGGGYTTPRPYSPTYQEAPQPNYPELYVFDPPSNVRATPNGLVQCVINKTKSVIVFGSVSTNSGRWYKTNACNAMGFIHESQLR